MKELLTTIQQSLGVAVWIEITTENPNCIYYFGPFLNYKEAELAKSGYVEDLEKEGARTVKLVIKRCKPDNLTVFDERNEYQNFQQIPRLSGQLF